MINWKNTSIATMMYVSDTVLQCRDGLIGNYDYYYYYYQLFQFYKYFDKISQKIVHYFT